jgi:tetratricopeptide (TPR) repeat protein
MMKSRRNLLWVAAAAAIVAVLAFLPALRNGFVGWDDDIYITQNREIRSIGLPFLRWAFFGFDISGNWHPLTWISHALDRAFWGLDPMGHHLTSVVLHGLNTFLVALLAGRLLETGGTRDLRTGGRSLLIAAGTTALLFGIHPLRVESVVWVAERKDVLCAVFFLASLLAWTVFATAPGNSRPSARPSRFRDRRYLASLGLFLLALLAKPMAVTLPLVLLILDWHPYRRITTARSLRAAVVEKVPFLLLSLLSAVMTLRAHRLVKAVAEQELVPLASRVVLAADALVQYLFKTLWPFDLSPFYAHPLAVEPFSLRYLLPAALVLGATAAAVAAARRSRIWPAAWAYYVIMLLPVLGIVQIGSQAMADRYTYLPGIAPALLLGITASRVDGWAQGRRPAVAFLAAPAIALMLVLAVLTVRQTAVWKDGVTLWTSVIKRDPVSVPRMIYGNRGVAYLRQGSFVEAIADFDRVIAFDPANYEARFRRGIAWSRMGRLDRAVADFDQVAAMDPAYTYVYKERGKAYDRLNRLADAAEDFDRAIALNPADAEAYLYRGIVAGKTGDREQAIRLFSRSLEFDPDDPTAYANRGLAWSLQGRADRALEDLDRAVSLGGNEDAYLVRSQVHLKRGDHEAALRDLARACELGSRSACDLLQQLRQAPQEAAGQP